VRERLKTSYRDTGRPSIDPELLLRLLLIGYLYGITSERKLIEACIWRGAASPDLYGIAGADGKGINAFPGVIFEYSAAGVESTLSTFCIGFTCPNGNGPYGNLLLDGGNLYGTTYEGGAGGVGIVYELTTAGIETLLYSFDFNVTEDGVEPLSGVIADQAGNLYGTTLGGGAQGKGAVFKLTKN